WYFASIAFWIISAVSAALYRIPETALMALVAAAIPLAIVKGFVISKVSSSRMLRIGQLFGFVVSNVVMLFVSRLAEANGTIHTVIPVLWALGSVLGIGLLAYRNYVHIAAIVFFMVVYAMGV